jgi:peptide/nickel transport system substrate-binding protein
LLVLAACGDDSGSSTATSTGGATTAAAPTSAGGAATTTATTTGSGSGDAGANPTDVCKSGMPSHDLSLALNTETSGLDPKTAATSGRTGAIELASIYGVLMSYDADSKTYRPELAESLEPNSTLDTWTLKLRPGITFGDGSPMTAADVKASIARHQENGARLKSLAAEITSMDVVDDHTLTFHLGSPWGELPFVLGTPVGMIVNPRVLEARGADALTKDATGAGAGPFEQVSYEPGERLVVQAKQGWWGGPVCLGKVTYTWLGDATLNYQAFTTNQADVSLFSDPAVAAQARSDKVANVGFQYGLGRTVVINAGKDDGKSPMGDVRVRQAVAHAIDPKAIDQRVTGGVGSPTSGIFAPGMASYPGVDGPAYDVDQAKSLLAAAKADLGWDGKIGLVSGNTPAGQEAALAVEAELDAVGFDVNLEMVDTNTLVQRLTVTADFDLIFSQSSVSEIAPWVRLEQFRSNSSRNRGSFKDPAMDQALGQLRVAATADQRKAALAQVQQVWDDTVPAINTATSEDVVIWHDDVHGLRFSLESTLLLDKAYVAG